MSSEEIQEAGSEADRRSTDRRKWIVEVQFEGGDATGITQTEDVSLGGLYMVTESDLPTGTRVFLKLTVAGEKLEVGGIVAYSATGRGVGVRFEDPSEEVIKVLRDKLGLE